MIDGFGSENFMSVQESDWCAIEVGAGLTQLGATSGP